MYKVRFISVFLFMLLLNIATCDMSNYKYIDEFKAFYRDHTKSVYWLEALETCAKENAVLWVPTDLEEANAVFELFELDWYRWTGFSDREKEGNWMSITGDKLTDVYNHWRVVEPDGGSEQNCAIIAVEGYLADANCRWEYPFICKKNVQTSSGNLKKPRLESNVEENIVLPKRDFKKPHLAEIIEVFPKELVIKENYKRPESMKLLIWNENEESLKPSSDDDFKTKQNKDDTVEKMDDLHEHQSELMEVIMKHRIIEVNESIKEDNKRYFEDIKNLLDEILYKIKDDFKTGIYGDQKGLTEILEPMNKRLSSIEEILKESNEEKRQEQMFEEAANNINGEENDLRPVVEQRYMNIYPLTIRRDSFGSNDVNRKEPTIQNERQDSFKSLAVFSELKGVKNIDEPQATSDEIKKELEIDNTDYVTQTENPNEFEDLESITTPNQVLFKSILNILI